MHEKNFTGSLTSLPENISYNNKNDSNNSLFHLSFEQERNCCNNNIHTKNKSR